LCDGYFPAELDCDSHDWRYDYWPRSESGYRASGQDATVKRLNDVPQPWREPQHRAGERDERELIIQLHGGNYPTQFITAKHFSNTNPVTIESFPGEQAVFTGPTSNPSSSTNAVYFGDVQGLRIKNVTVTAPYSSTGIKIDCGIHVEIDGVKINNTGTQIATTYGGQGILIGSAAPVHPLTALAATMSRSGTARFPIGRRDREEALRQAIPTASTPGNSITA
jgi:hypothetical protein